MAHCKDPNCKEPHYAIGKYKYHPKPKKDEIKPSKKSYIKPMSDKQSDRLKEYRRVRDEYMSVYKTCEFPECNNTSTDLHHGAGRTGDLLTNTKYFVALCRNHHQWVEMNPLEAKEYGLSFNRLDK